MLHDVSLGRRYTSIACIVFYVACLFVWLVGFVCLFVCLFGWLVCFVCLFGWFVCFVCLFVCLLRCRVQQSTSLCLVMLERPA
jgi:hypothetical protein